MMKSTFLSSLHQVEDEFSFVVSWQLFLILLFFLSSEFANATRRGLFGDAILEMDTSINNLLQAVESLGISQNTFIFFTSDNGPWLDQQLNGGCAGLFYGEKGETWEGGFREPAFAYWPGVVAPGMHTYKIRNFELVSDAFRLKALYRIK